MGDNSSEQDRYLALARKALAAADVMKDPQAQTTMRQIANGYLAMARQAEQREPTITPAAPKPKSSTG
jgi:hypothetical protein